MPAKEGPEVMVRVEIEDRDLGEIGYKAYRTKTGGVSLVSGQKIPEWDALPASIQEAWAAAGREINITVATRLSEALTEMNARARGYENGWMIPK